MLMEVDSASVVKTQVEALRDDVRQKMRDGRIGISGGIAVEPRGVLVRIADPAERAKALALLQSLSQPIGGALAGGNGRTLDVAGTDSGVQLTLTDASIAAKVAPGGGAIDRGAQPPHQRDGHQGNRGRAAGREPHIDRGAGPSGHDEAERDHRPDREARIPPGRRPRRAGERRRDAADADRPRNGPGRETRHGGRRRPRRRPAEFRPADRRAGRHLPLQSSRRPEVRSGHLGKRRPAVRNRAGRQGHFRTRHSFADHRRDRPDHRQFHARAGLEPRNPACAPARCRRSSRWSRSAPSVPASARTRSTPANARPTSGRPWSSST